MKIQSERTAQTQADLVAAFWVHYKEKPINKITVKEVTDTAGYYRSTLYYYFEDVYAILEYIEDSVIADWEASITAVLKNGLEILMQNNVQVLIEQIKPFYIKNAEYISVLLGPNGDPLFQQRVKDTLRSRLFTMLDIPQHSTEAQIFFECVSSGMIALFVKGYNDKLPLETIITVLKKIINRNVQTIILEYSSNPLLSRLAANA